MQEDEALVAAGKAVEEMARTTSRAIDAGEKFGGFIARYIGGSLEQGFGIFEDKLRYMRWERQARLIARAEQLMSDLGMKGPTRAISIKLAVPLLEAASLEENDDLQDLWARLLVNGADVESEVDLQRVYIDILEQITSLEASILEKVYSLPFDKDGNSSVAAAELPGSAFAVGHVERVHLAKEPRDDVKLAIANLCRLGCLTIQKTWGGGEVFTSVNQTLLGKRFVEACTLRKSICL